MLADQRFTSRYELLHLPYPVTDVPELEPASPGDLSGVDAPQHTRYRRLLAGKLTVRRMRQLTDRIEQITAEMLDAMERHGPPVDLVTALDIVIACDWNRSRSTRGTPSISQITCAGTGCA